MTSFDTDPTGESGTPTDDVLVPPGEDATPASETSTDPDAAAAPDAVSPADDVAESDGTSTGDGATSEDGSGATDAGEPDGASTDVPVVPDVIVMPGETDSDGDTISDLHEGAATGVDTDGDGTPDYLDTDSDDDTIEDSREAGDADLATMPRDADRDGTPDFRDLDSDGNALADRVEGADDRDGDGTPDFADADNDGDFISDAREFGAMPGVRVDTDSDGAPDDTDPDSDGDTIPDLREAGDEDLTTDPRDSDHDGTPDFRDLDSDGNGWPDREEGAADVDGDRTPDFADDDNEGDFIPDAREIGPTPTSPVDTDRDGIADLNEIDSDNDLIKDADESFADTDRDRMEDRVDTDSDNDSWTDREEAGDTNLDTPPVDTDGDAIPDFRDPDSDNDGLSDRLERTNGTSRTAGDTDGDGVSDLVEVGAGTRPNDRADSPRTRGNFVFVVPFNGPPSPARDTLQFSTTIQRADVYFLMDTTGSMGEEINNLKSGINTTLIPEIRRRIPDAWMGVGRYDDYPRSPFGATSDRPLRHITDITNADATVRSGVGTLTLGNGADGPESGLQAIWATITGGALTYPGGSVAARTGCPATRFGYPCFRPDAVPVIINFTDAPFHNGPSNTNPYNFAGPPAYDAVVSALTDQRARVLTVYSGGGTGTQGYQHGAAIATATGATSGGSPFVYPISSNGTGLTTAVVDGIEAVSRLAIDVSVRASDVVESGESVNAVTAFIDHLEARTSAAPGLMCTTSYPAYDRAGIDDDSHTDTFRGVRGDPVCFDIVTKMNTVVRPTENPQLFRARLNVIGDGFTPLDEREIFFLVPPVVPEPN